MGATKTVADRLADIQKRQLANITDPETRNAFTKLWTQTSDSTKDTVANHEMGQLDVYKTTTQLTAQDGAIRTAYDYYNNVPAIDRAIEDYTQATLAMGTGKDRSVVNAEIADGISKIHLAAISRWAAEDPTKALDYYNSHVSDIQGKDHITATALVDTAKQTYAAQQNVNRIIQSGGAAEQIWPFLEDAESSGRADAKSPKGALGVGQVMPGTAREILTNLGYADYAAYSDSQLHELFTANPDLNRQVGKTYLTQMLNRYQGDQEAALVAYNAGPKWADEFLRVNAGVMPGARSYDIPGNPKVKSETEPYVQKVLGNMGASAPAPGSRMTRDNWTLKNFQPSDLLAPTAGGAWVDAAAASALDQVTTLFKQQFPGREVRVNDRRPWQPGDNTAGLRRGTADPADNPHVSKSEHLNGRAFDVQVQGWSREEKAAFLTAARQAGFGGVGFYEGGSGHLHIDMGRDRHWGRVPSWATWALRTPVRVDRQSTAPGAGYAGLGTNSRNSAFAPAKNDNMPGWLAAANEIPDPSQRERTIALLRIADSTQTTRIKQEEAANKQAAWDMVVEGTSVQKIPPQLIARLEPGFVNSLYEYENKRASNDLKTDWAAWAQFPTDPEELANLDVYTEYRNKLGDTEFKQALEMKRAAVAKLAGQQYDSELLAGARTRSDLIADITAEQGWNTKYTAGQQSLAQFNRKLDERVIAEQAALKRRLTPVEIQDIADKLLLKDRNTTWGFGGQGQALETKRPNDFIAADSWDEVQEDDKFSVTERYQQLYGELPNEETATDLYNRAMQVWLGGRATGPADERSALQDSLEKKLGRQLTDTEMDTYYARYLLKFLGR